jgi:hypothetical protein
MKQKLSELTIKLVYREDEARWFGRVVGEFDNNGNEIDCFLPTVVMAIDCLVSQLIEEDII